MKEGAFLTEVWWIKLSKMVELDGLYRCTYLYISS
jgi:hypothetical protein